MPRRKKSSLITNASEYYEPLRKKRNVKRILQYATPIIRNPSVAQRGKMTTTKHIWKYGDRLYTLAHNYYGDSTFWWVIAWWNGYGIEGDIKEGAVLSIPMDISLALKMWGV